MGISVIIITLEEEKNIRACLESIKWANEIIVVDSKSKDKTTSIAREYTEKVFVIEWMGYGDTKNFALSKVNNEWVFWIDADERCSHDLSREIQSIIAQPSGSFKAYVVARRAYFLGKWIKHCGWYPGYVVRLFKKEFAKFSSSHVHEKVEIDGEVGKLKHDLFHYTDGNLFHYFSKFNRYTSLAATELHEKGKRFSFFDVFIRPPFLFLKMFVFRLGFLDGIHGFILSILSACYVFVKYAKLWELNLQNHENFKEE